MADDTPILVSETEVAPTKRGGDVRSMTVQQEYVPRADGESDPYAAADQRLARLIAEILVKHFYGYTWQVIAETCHGVVAFAIPDLMGSTLKMVMRLPEFPEMLERDVVHRAGELLERMHLRRGPMDQAEYEHAKQNMHLFQFEDVKQ